MGFGGRFSFRIGVVVVTLAGVLVPAWIAPAETLSVPETLAHTVRLDDVVTRRTTGAAQLVFRPTHIAFSWVGSEDVTISYRTDATAWQVAPLAHDADTPTRHYTGVLWVDRPTSLEWKVDPAPGAVVSDVTLDYLNTLDGPRVATTVPATAAAEARAPKIVTRAQWGADESLKRMSGGCKRTFHPVRQLFVHHTAGSNFDQHPKATMRAIYWYHVVRQGWCDIGYNFVVSYDGRVFEGRWARNYSPWEVHDGENRSGDGVTGAHVDGFNSGSVGISVMGNFEEARPSPAATRALAELLAWEIDRHDLRARGLHTYENPESGRTVTLPWVAGHRDADSTDCPGDHLYRSLSRVRRDAVAVMGDGKTSTRMTTVASQEQIGYGDEVAISGVLTDADGVALPDRPVRTYVKRGTNDWVAGRATTTGPDGTFSITMQPGRNIRVATIYDGDLTTWGSEDRVVVKVNPSVTLEAHDATVDAGGVYHYAPGTEQIAFSGSVVPRHTGHAVRILIDKVQPDGSVARLDEGSAEIDGDGLFFFDWTVVDPGTGGTYHAHAVFPKDDDHTRGISVTITFVIDPEP